MDIIVTTPKNQILLAQQEAEYIKNQGGGTYFRSLSSHPTDIRIGNKVFYTEDGYIRGYALICGFETEPALCDVSGKLWKGGFKVIMDAKTWTWIEPVPMKGFQGYRYVNKGDFPVVPIGTWLDPKPKVMK